MTAEPARVVADADVLVADLLVGGTARDALDHLRRHSWTTLVASPPLLEDATAILTHFGDEELAQEWRTRLEAWAEIVTHPDADHPALGAARAGSAAHVLTLDGSLASAQTNVSLQRWLDVSVRQPDAFVELFDPASLYSVVVGGEYSGPDRDPRS